MESPYKSSKMLALDALADKIKRRRMREQVQIGCRVPGNLVDGLDAMARELKCTRSDVVRLLLDAAVSEVFADIAEPFKRLEKYRDKLC